MKRWLPFLTVTAVVMLFLPWMAVRFAPRDAGMAICFLLFFGVNPLLAAGMGVLAGLLRAWQWPLVVAGAFLLGAWLAFAPGETAFLLFAGAYLALGYAVMALTRLIRRYSKER